MAAGSGQGQRKGDFLAGKYLLEDCLGIGGMGEVYRATNVSLGRKVAIKILSPEFVNIEDDVLRFLREARAAAAVRHANVVDVLDVARDDDGTPFIVQELLSGEDLEQYLLARGGRLPCSEAVEIMLDVADAVAAAHAQNVVHRDLKPANIFLARDRNKTTPKVLDFGACLFPTIAARSAKEIRMLIGTPHYMAPEQIVNKAEVDARSDVWALGVILYEMIAGESPFDAPSMDAVLDLVKTKDVPPLRARVPDAPESLERVIARCTRRDRLARYPDAGALHLDLVGVRESAPVHRPMPAPVIPSLESQPRVKAKLLTLSSPGSEPPGPRMLETESGPLDAIDLAARPSSWPPPQASRPISAPPSKPVSSHPVSSLPLVLDPRAARSAPKEPPGAKEAFPPLRGVGSAARDGPPMVAKPAPVERVREWTSAEKVKFLAIAALPALGGFVALRTVQVLGAPLGRALRGDSPLASGVLAVVALVSALALCARSVLQKSDCWQRVAAGGGLLFAIAMIIVTFSASEAAALGVPSSTAGLSTFVAPIAPLALGLGALARARAAWVDPYAKSEALRAAVLASAMFFLVLALSPVGAIRVRSQEVVSGTG